MNNSDQNGMISALSLRWINVQTFEIMLPGGKVILTDPQFSPPLPEDEKARYYKIPEKYQLDRDKIQRVDYIIINHTHCDHLIDLGYFTKKFNPLVICHECIAYDLAKAFDIPFTSIYPISGQGKCEFQDFTIYTFPGSHMPQPFTYTSMPNILKQSYGVDGMNMKELGHLGGLFNMNYVLQVPGNLRIAFWAGRLDGRAYPVMKQMATYYPNFVLRQIPLRLPEHAETIYARELQELGAAIMLPMHHERYEIAMPGALEQLFAGINEEMKKCGMCGRAFVPQRGKWYSVSFGMKLL